MASAESAGWRRNLSGARTTTSTSTPTQSGSLEGCVASKSPSSPAGVRSSGARSSDEVTKKAVWACQYGDVALLETFLAVGGSPNLVDSDGCSLLHWAAINNQLGIIDKLLERKVDVNMIGGVLKSSPLHWAVHAGHVLSAVALVKASANGEICNANGECPLHLACKGPHCNLVAYLLVKFESTKDFRDNQGQTPLMYVTCFTFSMFPIRILLGSGVDVDTFDAKGNTALHLAVERNNSVTARELLRCDARLDIKNREDLIPYELAKKLENKKMQRLLSDLPDDEKHGKGGRKFRQILFALLPILTVTLVAAFFALLHFTLAFGLVVVLAAVLILYFDKCNVIGSRYFPVSYVVTLGILQIGCWRVEFDYLTRLQLPFLIGWIMCTLLFLKLFFKDPGRIVPPENRQLEFVRRLEAGNNDVHCFTCWVAKPPLSHHCSVCDHCVRKFDHHCPWLHRCITRKNLREFMGFIAAACLMSIGYIANVCYVFYRHVVANSWESAGRKFGFLLLTLLPPACHIIVLLSMLFTQTSQILSSTTTIERLNRKKAAELSSTSSTTTTSASSAARSSQTDCRHGRQEFRPPTCGQRLQNLVEFCSSSE